MSETTNGAPGAEYLHVTLHLVNGGRTAFVQTEAEAAKNLLDHLRPERIFAQKQFLLQGDDSVTIIPSENIERVDLRSEPIPAWTHDGAIAAVKEITEENFVRIVRREPPTVRKVLGKAMPAPPLEIGVMAELRSGQFAYLSLRRRLPAGGTPPPAPTPDDIRVVLQHMFTRPIVFGESADGEGLFLLNPANVVRYTLAPTPPDTVSGAWRMQISL